MCRKMQGEDEVKVWEQGFKACNTPVETDKMMLNTFLWFLMFLKKLCLLQQQLSSTPSFVS